MPIKVKKSLICNKCGKNFEAEINDAILPKDAELLKNPMCKKCRAIKKFKKILKSN